MDLHHFFSNGKAFVTAYPLPVLAGLGLFLGISLQFYGHAPHIAHLIWLTVILSIGSWLVLQTLIKIAHKQFSADIIAALAIITALIMNEAFTGAVIVLMQSGGEALEKFGLKRAMFSLDALLSRAPQHAFRKVSDHFERIPVQDVKVGDHLLIKPGDLIPVDGTIIEGEGEIDTSALTGEPFPRFMRQDGRLFSGSILVNGALEMRADHLSADSQYAKIVTLVEKAQHEKAPIQRLADRYAIFFTPLTLVMAAIGFLITQDTQTILAVLVVATPCPLILATPIAVLSALNGAAQKGIIVKGGVPLEEIAHTQVALFDKTSTLTDGLPDLDKIIPYGDATPNDVLLNAAILEQFSSHAVAKAICQAAKTQFQTLPRPDHFDETPGQGVTGEWENKQIAVGSISYVNSHFEPEIGEAFAALLKAHTLEAKLVTCVMADNKPVGIIAFEDKPRNNAKSTIQALRELGIKHIVMLTGDNQQNAMNVANAVGINEVHANLLPEGKVEQINAWGKKYPYTLMIGDGINDAPALATARVGIAMGAQGTAISAEAAEIVLLEDDLSKVVTAIKIGKRMLTIARQSILIGIGLSFVLMVIAAFGGISPPVGAILQEIIDIAVILNALRARQ